MYRKKGNIKIILFIIIINKSGKLLIYGIRLPFNILKLT